MVELRKTDPEKSAELSAMLSDQLLDMSNQMNKTLAEVKNQIKTGTLKEEIENLKQYQIAVH